MPGGLTAPSPEGTYSRDLRFRVLILVLIFAYCFAVYEVIGFRPDHFFLSMIVLVFLLSGKEWGIRFLIDWSPFILFWVAYDMMRGVADSMRSYVMVAEPYNIEKWLFGWLTGSTVPAFYLQRIQSLYEGNLIKILIDVGTTGIYVFHFLSPLLLGWFFWHTLKERRNFYFFIYTLTVLNAMALLTYVALPSAPPWYVYTHGFAQPSAEFLDSAGALVNFDKLLGSDYLRSFWNTFNANRFAAIPSLHGAYPVVIALFIWLRFGGLSWISGIYPLGAWFSAVYLNHHYILDLIAGTIYVIAAYYIAKKVLMPHLFDKIVNYDVKSNPGSLPVKR